MTFSIGGAVVWYRSTRLAAGWHRRRLPWVGLLIGACALAGGSFLVTVLATSLPLP